MHFNALQVSLLKEMINDSKNSELCLMFQGMWHIIFYGAFIALWFIQFCTTNDKKIKKKKFVLIVWFGSRGSNVFIP